MPIEYLDRMQFETAEQKRRRKNRMTIFTGGPSDVFTFSDQPFSATDFAGSSSLIWTVIAANVNKFRFGINVKMMSMMFDLVNTTIGGTVTNAFLQVKIPGGRTPRQTAEVPFTYIDNGGVPTTGYCIITKDSNILNFRPAAGANWSLSTNATRIGFNQQFEIN